MLARRKKAGPGLRLLVGLCALSTSGGSLHEMLTVHRVCAEHGELVEIAGESPRASSQSPAVSPGLPGSPETGHEHCSLTSHRRSAAFSPAPAGWGPAVLTHGPAIEAAAPPVAVAILRFAPKTSPPV